MGCIGRSSIIPTRESKGFGMTVDEEFRGNLISIFTHLVNISEAAMKQQPVPEWDAAITSLQFASGVAVTIKQLLRPGDSIPSFLQFPPNKPTEE